MFDIGSLGTIMAIFAHPDDETFTCGGLLSMAVANGQTVICVTATRGEAGVRDEKRWPADKLGQIREHELEEALKILGISHHHWLDYEDGRCHQIPDTEAVAKLIKLVDKYQPDTILTFGPDGLTGHQDHQAASRWSNLAIKHSHKPVEIYYVIDSEEQYNNFTKAADEKFDIYFNIDKPTLVSRAKCDICLKLPTDVVKKKISSLKAQISQTDAMFKQNGGDWFSKVYAYETFVNANRHDIKWQTALS